MRGLIRIIMWAVVAVVAYFVITLNFDTPVSDRARLEYSSMQGYLESVDLTNLEGEGSKAIGSLSSLVSEVWQVVSSSLSSLYQSVPLFNPEQRLIANNPKLATAIPAILPIKESKLKSKIGGYGLRIHPLKGQIIKHKGVDLSCDIGSAVFATGDGVVERSDQGESKRGYGEMLLLNHGAGYKSRYAHLSSRLVSVGDVVRRGDVIALSGNTGGSTGPHLHYEVIVNGSAVNPKRFLTLYQQLDQSIKDER